MKKTGLLFISLLLLTVISVSGVYGIWTYYNDVNPVTDSYDVGVAEWYYGGELPGAGSEDDSMIHAGGNNHAGLVEDIRKEVSKGVTSGILDALIGAINANIDEDGVYQNAKFGSTNKYLKQFLEGTGYDNVGFFIYYGLPENMDENGKFYKDSSKLTALHIYTYALDEISSARVGEEITTYKVLMIKVDGEWKLSGGWEGLAKVMQYSNKHTTGNQKNTIDPETWRDIHGDEPHYL